MKRRKTDKRIIDNRFFAKIGVKGRIAAAALPCAAVMLALVILLTGGGVSLAGVSLPHVESIAQELKEPGSAYNILEIAPVPSRYFGYYIDGQEPGIAGWEAHVATLYGPGGRAAREAYMNGAAVYGTLNSASVLGTSGDTHPLTWLGNYKEYYPWDSGAAGLRSLQLANYESGIAAGLMVYHPGGAYQASYEYTPGNTGEFTMIVTALEYNSAGSAEYFFAAPSFMGPLEHSNIDGEERPVYKDSGTEIPVNPGTPLYKLADGATYPGGPFVFEGILSEALYGAIQIGEKYYIITDYGNALETVSNYALISPYPADDSYFVPVSEFENITGYALPGGALFTRTATSYTYVGEGNGDHRLDTGTADYEVFYNTVYYEGGFKNNNWFLRYVFDRDETELASYKGKVIVNSKLPGEITIEDIDKADLIILAQGTAGLSAEIALRIYNVSTQTGGYVPVVFDHSLNSAGANNTDITRRLVRALAAKATNAPQVNTLPAGTASITDANGVRDNIFWTNKPVSLLREVYNTLPAAFSVVRNEIDNENFLRTQQGIASLSTDISNATAVRYVINFSGKRIENKWDSINVLEIQPGEIPSGSSESNKDLTIAKVRSWVGDQNVTVNITRMSMYEFIGKIEDLNQQYHLIYIGGSAVGINPSATAHGSTVSYNDPNMYGLLYTNIGDTYRLTNSHGNNGRVADVMAMLDGYVEGADADSQYRLSGNDITKVKMDDILDFTAAGYPVIIDERLVSPVVTGYRMPTSPCPACGSTTQWDNSSLPNWGGGEAGSWLQCNGRYMTPPTYPYCGLQFSDWSYGATNNGANNNTPGRYTIPADAFIYGGYTADNNRVDNSSLIYDLLIDILKKPNVFNSGEAVANSATIGRYLNLSKPEIEFTRTNGVHNKPVPYTGISGPVLGDTDDVNTLRYEFYIRNKTDATPTETTYDVRLYLDLNSDGRYREDERLLDIVVTDSNGNTLSRVNGVYQLYADRLYTVTRRMPREAVGLYAWSLKVTKNGSSDTIRSSQIDYTRIAPAGEDAKKIINILHVASSQTLPYSMGVKLNLEAQCVSSATGSNPQLRGNDGLYYAGIYGKLLADVDDFKINIITVYAAQLDALNTHYNNSSRLGLYLNGRLTNAAGDYIQLSNLRFNETNRQDSLARVFNTFDMLILGFDDCYAELSTQASRAVVGFIDTQKAVLFTHDTTSFYSNPAHYDAGVAWGITFNNYLRDAVKLDRYGISRRNQAGAFDSWASSLRSWNWNAGDTRHNLPASGGRRDIVNALDTAGYSIAYRANSGSGATVRDTHGYTNYHLKTMRGSTNNTTFRYDTFLGTDMNNARTRRISQVNEGKITTYPYDLNMSTMSVPETHEQYFQINMNNDEIVVWYCLDDTFYAKNDVMNAYYIYNCGNITYSGAGHSSNQNDFTGSNISEGVINEAKLFVNTMIAAYRAGAESPSVSIKDETGKFDIEYHLLPSDGSLLTMALPGDPNRQVYFSFTDTNMNTNKNIHLRLSYQPGVPDCCLTGTALNHEHLTQLNGSGAVQNYVPDVYVGSTNNKVTGSLQGGIIYRFELPAGVLDMLSADTEGRGVTIRLEVVTVIPSSTQGNPDVELRGFSNPDLKVRVIELFNLG